MVVVEAAPIPPAGKYHKLSEKGKRLTFKNPNI